MPACANERRIAAVCQFNAGCKLADTPRRAAAKHLPVVSASKPTRKPPLDPACAASIPGALLDGPPGRSASRIVAIVTGNPEGAVKVGDNRRVGYMIHDTEIEHKAAEFSISPINVEKD